MPRSTKRSTAKEQTGPQSTEVGGFGTFSLAPRLQATYATYRTIAKHPTIALAETLSISPVAGATWSTEADDGVEDDRIEFIQGMFEPLRQPLVETAMRGGIHFGWQPFEQVFESRDGRWVVKKIKPLLQELTEILVTTETGAIVGYKQQRPKAAILPVDNILHIGFRVEGTSWHGSSLLENARGSYNDWVACNLGAARYDARVAGSHTIVHYPVGSSKYEGVMTDNTVIAQKVVDSLASSQIFKFPRIGKSTGKDLPPGWQIEILSDQTAKQVSFTARLEYIDKLLVRALLMPERALLEGHHGTLAEAEEHADLWITSLELLHAHITTMVNWHAVDRILAANFGEEARGSVRLVANPIADERRKDMREVYRLILQNPVGFAEAGGLIDIDSLMDAMGIPKSDQVVNPGAPAPDADTPVNDAA